MNKILQDIEIASHIEIEVQEESIALGSALYTYVLTRHKKVSFVCKTKEIDLKYSFLPWVEKIRTTNYSSADLSIKLQSSFIELYSTLKLSEVNINSKMATALYSALVLETDNFTNSKTNGAFFAIASELIESGAEHKKSVQYLVKRCKLSELRLKSIMLEKMILKDSSKLAEFTLSDYDLKATGATIDDAQNIMKEALGLEYVQSVVLLDINSKIIKKISKEI